jgi:hypothetical protein
MIGWIGASMHDGSFSSLFSFFLLGYVPQVAVTVPLPSGTSRASKFARGKSSPVQGQDPPSSSSWLCCPVEQRSVREVMQDHLPAQVAQKPQIHNFVCLIQAPLCVLRGGGRKLLCELWLTKSGSVARRSSFFGAGSTNRAGWLLLLFRSLASRRSSCPRIPQSVAERL